MLRLAIIVGLSDRERFINKVTAIIEDFEHDPEKAEKWAMLLMDYLKDVKENINRERTIKGVVSSANLPDREHIEELTKAIRDLTRQLQDKEGPTDV